MKQEIIDKMTQIVESNMQSYKIDFYKYDKNELAGYEGSFVWSVTPYHTYLCKLDIHELEDVLMQYESNRFLLMNKYSSYFCGAVLSDSDSKNGTVFLYDGVRLKAIDNDTLHSMYNVIKENLKRLVMSKFPDEAKYYNTHIPVHFSCIDEFKRFLAIARTEEGARLVERVKHFRRYQRLYVDHKIVIGYDSYQKSFSFWEEFEVDAHHLNGGIIYNPPTVDCEATWSIHT